jgi:hypothetical protein
VHRGIVKLPRSMRLRRLTVSVSAGLLAGLALTRCAQFAPGDVLPPEADAASFETSIDQTSPDASSDRTSDIESSIDQTSAVEASMDRTSPDAWSDPTSPIEASDAPSEADADSSPPPCDDSNGTAGFDAWYRLPALPASAKTWLSAADDGAQSLVLYAVDTSGHPSVATAPLRLAAWSDWATLPVPEAGLLPNATLTPVVRAPGVVDVLAIDAAGSLVGLFSGSPGAWVQVGSDAPAFPAQPVAAWARDSLHADLFAIANGAVYTTEYAADGGASVAWTTIDAAAPSFRSTSHVVLAVHHATVVDLFVQGEFDQRIWNTTRDYAGSAGWQPWIPVGDPIASYAKDIPPAATSYRPTEVDLFAINPENTTWADYRDDQSNDGEWYGWFGLPWVETLPRASIAALGEPAPGRLNAFVPASTGVVESCWYPWVPPQGNPQWHPWVPLAAGCDGPAGALRVETLLDSAGTTEAFAVDDAGVVWATERRTGP